MSKQSILEQLRLGPQTITELSAATGLTYTTVMRQCRALHDDFKIHIVAWEKSMDIGFMRHSKVYASGAGRDEPRPRLLSAAMRNAAYRMRIADARKARARAAVGVWGGLMV